MADNGFTPVFASRGIKKAALEAATAAAAAQAKANKNAVNAAVRAAAEQVRLERAKKHANTKKYVESYFGPRLPALLRQVKEPQNMLYGPQRVLSEANQYEILAQIANAKKRNADAYAAVSKWAGGKRRTRRVHKSRRKTKRRL